MNAANRKRLLYVVLIGLVLTVQACTAATTPTDEDVSTAQPTEITIEASEEPTPETAEPTSTKAATALTAPTEASEEPTPETAEPTAVEIPADLVGVCPEPTADTRLYIDQTNGFCLLYPASFTLESDPDRSSLFTNARFQGSALFGKGTETVYATLRVNVVGQPGAAKGYTMADYADLLFGESSTLAYVPREDITLGSGQSAVVRKMTAFSYFFVLNAAVHDTLYEVIVSPTNTDSAGDLAPDVELAWTTMLDSLTFFPPAYSGEILIPEEICPEPTADTYLYIHRELGYCVLVPNSFEEDPEHGMGWFIGGPELTGLPMGDRVLATIGMYENKFDETVEELADVHISAYHDSDPIIRVDTTVSGLPAVFWDRPQANVPSRTMVILANGYLYILYIRPVDPVNYPEAVESAELVWNTFIDSFVFFEPWL